MRSLPARGVSLVDVLVGSALVLILFLGLFTIIRTSLAITSLARLKSSATAIAETRMEYIRSLSYDSIGTVGGIPAGIIPQYATTTLEGTVEFVTRTFIEYADDPADGTGAADSNGVTTDYKHVKVVTSYIGNRTARSVTLVSNASPPGIETTTGGGTLQATVVDAVGGPVAGASVRVINSSLSPSVDVTTFSDASGVVYLGGAEPSTEYQVYVSKDGYSSAQTYERDATNVNPTPGFLTVVENQTTTSTFAIDLLSTLTIKTFSPIAPGSFSDSFADASGIADATDAEAGGGALSLAGIVGSYAASGEALASTTAPSYLATWEDASFTLSLPPGTDARVSITDGSGILLPDVVLPGNSAGFTTTIDLSGVSTTTYPQLALRASLSTSDANVTPSILDWTLGYTAGPTPLPNVDFTLTGAKTVGSTALGDSIFKTEIATSTDSMGIRVLSLEWDSYSISIPGFTTVSEDPLSPYDVLSGIPLTASLILSP